MANWFTTLYREIRPNFLYDVIKLIVIAAVSSLVVLGYRLLSLARQIPQDRVIDVAIFIVSFVLLLTAYGLARQANKQSDDLDEFADEPDQPTDAPEEVKEFTDVTVGQLTDFYKTHSTEDAQKLLAPFIGKWIPAVSGKILASYGYGPEFADVSLLLGDIDATEGTVLAGFFTPQSHHTYGVGRGAMVKVSGRIIAIEPTSITLSRCKLLDVKPPYPILY